MGNAGRRGETNIVRIVLQIIRAHTGGAGCLVGSDAVHAEIDTQTGRVAVLEKMELLEMRFPLPNEMTTPPLVNPLCSPLYQIVLPPAPPDVLAPIVLLLGGCAFPY